MKKSMDLTVLSVKYGRLGKLEKDGSRVTHRHRPGEEDRKFVLFANGKVSGPYSYVSDIEINNTRVVKRLAESGYRVLFPNGKESENFAYIYPAEADGSHILDINTESEHGQALLFPDVSQSALYFNISFLNNEGFRNVIDFSNRQYTMDCLGFEGVRYTQSGKEIFEYLQGKRKASELDPNIFLDEEVCDKLIKFSPAAKRSKIKQMVAQKRAIAQQYHDSRSNILINTMLNRYNTAEQVAEPTHMTTN